MVLVQLNPELINPGLAESHHIHNFYACSGSDFKYGNLQNIVNYQQKHKIRTLQ